MASEGVSPMVLILQLAILVSCTMETLAKKKFTEASK